MSQAWVNQRFDGLCPSDFGSEIRILPTADLHAPPNFEGVWPTPFIAELDADLPWSCEQLAGVHMILVLGDPSKPEQVQLLQYYERAFAEIPDAPMVMLVPHSVAPAARTEGDARAVSSDPLGALLIDDSCLEGIADGEPEGFALALAVRAMAAQTAAVASLADNVVQKRRADFVRAQEYSDAMDEIIWDYARVRLAPSLPPQIDCDDPDGLLPASLSDYKVGRKLGSGSCGSVFSLIARQTGHPQQVLKVMEKATIIELDELRCINRQIDVQQRLSSKELAHPNIACLHEVYHTCTNILFRMEFAGPMNLYTRLAERDKEGEFCRPMSKVLARVIVQQATLSVAHLHDVVQVCHRDIKPENFVLDESDSSPVLKLVDFDIAVDVRKGATCRGRCGTAPFIAPEVFLAEGYNAYAADVWSLAAVLLEVHCGVRVIERVLGLSSREPAAIAPKLKTFFERPDAVETLLEQLCRPDAQFLLPTTSAMLAGMLDVSADTRWEARQASDVAANFFARPVQPSTPSAVTGHDVQSTWRMARIKRVPGNHLLPASCEKVAASARSCSANRPRRIRPQAFKSSPATGACAAQVLAAVS